MYSRAAGQTNHCTKDEQHTAMNFICHAVDRRSGLSGWIVTAFSREVESGSV